MLEIYPTICRCALADKKYTFDIIATVISCISLLLAGASIYISTFRVVKNAMVKCTPDLISESNNYLEHSFIIGNSGNQTLAITSCIISVFRKETETTLLYPKIDTLTIKPSDIGTITILLPAVTPKVISNDGKIGISKIDGIGIRFHGIWADGTKTNADILANGQYSSLIKSMISSGSFKFTAE